MDYKWILQNGESAKEVKKFLLQGDLKQSLYNFINVCKMGYTDEELRMFVDGLLQDVEKE